MKQSGTSPEIMNNSATVTNPTIETHQALPGLIHEEETVEKE